MYRGLLSAIVFLQSIDRIIHRFGGGIHRQGRTVEDADVAAKPPLIRDIPAIGAWKNTSVNAVDVKRNDDPLLSRWNGTIPGVDFADLPVAADRPFGEYGDDFAASQPWFRLFERLFGSFEMDNAATLKTLDFHAPYTTEYCMEKMVKAFKEKS